MSTSQCVWFTSSGLVVAPIDLFLVCILSNVSGAELRFSGCYRIVCVCVCVPMHVCPCLFSFV